MCNVLPGSRHSSSRSSGHVYHFNPNLVGQEGTDPMTANGTRQAASNDENGRHWVVWSVAVVPVRHLASDFRKSISRGAFHGHGAKTVGPTLV